MKLNSNLSYSSRLRSLMQDANIASFKALGLLAQVSDWQIQQLRQGQASRMRVRVLCKLSQALQVPLAQLLEDFSEMHSDRQASTSAHTSPDHANPNHANLDADHSDLLLLRQEYERLQLQLEQQRQVLQQEFQQNCLRSLESWLIQFPTLVYAAQQNPQLPVQNFLPFMRPLEQLLQDWGVEAIAPVGAEVGYDPQMHQLLEGRAEPGDLVRVRYTGYHQGKKLLYRAKVSLVKLPRE